MEELRGKIREDVALILRSDDPDREVLLRSYFALPTTPEEKAEYGVAWCRLFLGHYFKDETPEFHYELAQIFFRGRNDYTAAPRGFAKTSLMQGLISYSVVNAWETYIVIVEKTFKEASEVLSAVRVEFEENEFLLPVGQVETFKQHLHLREPILLNSKV